MKRFTLSLSILFCLLALMPAASPIDAKENWISVRSKNFLLIGNTSEKQVRQVAVRLEQFREVFSHLFPGAVISTNYEPSDPSSYLREALRKPQAGETQAQGTLVRVDCDEKGMTFLIRLTDRLLKLSASSFESVEMTSFSADAGGEITCGLRKPENNVVVSYVGSTDARAKFDGMAKSLDFVPPDFKLKP